MADDWILFAELVQSTHQSGGREMVWARPLLLVHQQIGNVVTCDLSHTSDLLWPAAHFSPAYAEDMLPFMVDVARPTLDEARQQLRSFMQRVWDVHNASDNIEEMDK